MIRESILIRTGSISTEMEPYLLYQAIVLGYRFKEEPVTKIYPSKAVGYTKMTPVIGWWSIVRPLLLLSLGLKK